VLLVDILRPRKYTPAVMSQDLRRLICDTVSMFVILWQFDIAEDKLAAFEESYGPAGKWAQLFRASSEYYGTELLRDQHVPGRFVTVDRWSSLDAFVAFRRDHDADYEALDRASDSLTSAEVRIGSFEVVE